ncbi:MAG: hypothetical protein MJZ79_03440 [Paludibacteraceae bacterium]|nr:hypothetical protein [Paludibacteraceae bacterium]
MKKLYLTPLCEEIKVRATSDLLVGSVGPVPTDKYIPVVSGGGNINAD